jgi:SNF2 family DNA or RNA helicase
LHSITFDKKKIKIVFDKTIKGWTGDKQYIKNGIVDSYKDYASTLYVPCTGNNFRNLLQTYSDNDDYLFTDSFIDNYKAQIKREHEENNKLELLKEKVTLDNIDNRPDILDYSHLPEEIRRPFKHQKLGLEYACRIPAFYNLNEMGLGKTREAIERHRVLKEKLDRIDFSFVICPVSLMYNWYNEIKLWCKPGTQVLIIDGSRKNKLEEINLFKNQVDFFIINYEGVDSIKEELLNLITARTNIIIDEFIKIKNPSAKRTQNLIDICEKTEYVYGLCGTPISQGSIDLFSPSLCIDKGKKFGFSHDRFISKYYWKEGWKLIPKRGSTEKISDKLYRNALRFTKEECLDIPDKMYQEIILDLPAENRRVYEQMLNYCLAMMEDKHHKGQTKQVKAQIILVQLLRLSQITSGFVKTPDNKILEFQQQPKLDAIKDILETNNSHSIIIWSRFVRDIKAIANLLKNKNISFGCLVGKSKDFYYDTEEYNNPNSPERKNSPIYQLYDLIKPVSNNPEDVKKAYKQAVKSLHPDWNPNSTQEQIELLKKINALYTQVNRFNDIVLPNIPNTMKQNFYDIPNNLVGTDSFTRQSIVDKFQNGNIQVIVGTASTGGLGINLTRASRVIYYSNDYSLINRLQSEDRAHRSGQKNRVHYYDLIARDTIDTSIRKVLMSKKNVADIVTQDNLKSFIKGK